MLITGPLFLIHPYHPSDNKNGFTVTGEDGAIVAHTTTHEAAMAAARLMAIGFDYSSWEEPWSNNPFRVNPFDFEPDFGPVFKDGSQ